MKSSDHQSHATLWQDLRALPPRYWILFSGTLLNRFGHFVLPFLAVYLRREGYEAWVTASALAAFGAGALVAGALGGYLSDRLGRKITLLISTVGEMIALPMAHSYMANLAPEDMRGRYMGVLSVAWSSATMIGPAAGSALFHLNPPVLWVAVWMVAFLASRVVLSTRRQSEAGAGAMEMTEPVRNG